MLPTGDKAVVVTGCDSGFGLRLALDLCEQGVQVFAACLSLDSDGAKHLLSLQSPLMCVVKCDVTSDADVTDLRNCVERSLETERVLWAVVNNAGVNFTGDVELTTVELFKWVADVNYMGVVRVTKSFLPLIRKCKGPPQASVFQPSSNHNITSLQGGS